MEIDNYWAEAVVIILATLFSVAGLLLVRRTVGVASLAKCHDVGGSLLSVIGTMYAVLLGLIIVDSMGKFEVAKQNAQQEANALADVFFLANQYPEKSKEIQQLCLQYANLVIDKEWAQLDNNTSSTEARDTAIALVSAVEGVPVKGDREGNLLQSIVGEVTQVWDNRNARIFTARSGLPGPEWLVLLIGGALTVVFTYFFGLENVKVQILMSAIVTLIITLNLYLVLMFAYPYSGDVRVDPQVFTSDREIFQAQMNAPKAQLDSN